MSDLAGLSLVIGTVSGALTSFLVAKWGNRKTAAEVVKLKTDTESSVQRAFAETAQILAESSREQIREFMLDLERVRRERDGLSYDLDRLRRYVGELVDLMCRAGIDVPPFIRDPSGVRVDA